MQTTLSPIIDSDDKIVRIIAIESDISELKKAENEIFKQYKQIKKQHSLLQKQNTELDQYRNHLEDVVVKRTAELLAAKERAEESDHLKSAFLANMSHEIRTPLNAIIGFSGLLSNQNTNEEKRAECIELIQQSGHRLLNLINDIIDVSKIEAGQLKYNEKETDINELIDSLYSFFKDRANVRNIKFTINNRLLDDNPVLLTDKTKLRQILINLISNAIKFTETGSVGIEYFINDKFVEFHVTDTGIGIAENMHHIIFERFRRIEKVYTKNTGGTGLGFSLSKSFVEFLGGQISVVSEEGEGADFCFTIPYMPVKQETKNKKDKIKPKLDLSGKTILVAEDDESNFMLISILLEETNVRQIRACNGIEAVELYKRNQPINMVLMDIKMPEMDGFTATKAIKKINKLVPIIAQTAFAMEQDRITALENGCDDYISKPIDKNKLFDILAKFLG